MKKAYRYLALTLGLTLVVGSSFYLTSENGKSFRENLASIFFFDSVSTKAIIAKYKSALTSPAHNKTPNVKIMIVPGHDDASFGTQFKGVKEADLNVIVANELTRLLKTEKGIDVFQTRNEYGYNPELRNYIDNNKEEIASFYESKKGEMNRLIESGEVTSYINIHHNSARPEVATTLYGINKFANDNYYDIVIHIHFNDYPKRPSYGGKYSGFAVYIPERQYSNARASKDLGEKIKDQLSYLFAQSDLKKEGGIVEDQELIAIGANNTSDAISILMEYGYIYESQFHDAGVKEIVLPELARQTYLAVMSFLNDRKVTGSGFAKVNKQYLGNTFSKGDKGAGVLTLQDYLHNLGFYPYYQSLNDCPLNGRFGNCTEKSLKAIQEKYGIKVTGQFDLATRKALGL